MSTNLKLQTTGTTIVAMPDWCIECTSLEGKILEITVGDKRWHYADCVTLEEYDRWFSMMESARHDAQTTIKTLKLLVNDDETFDLIMDMRG